MTPAKTTKNNSSLETRSFDDFAMFNSPEYREGIQGLGTLQPLYDTRDDLAYLAIRESDLKGCKWTAKEDDFEENTVHWNRVHIFDGGDRETMHCFVAPRLQIIHASGILVIDNSIKNNKGRSMNITVGDLSMEPIKDAFNAEKIAAANAKPNPRQSKYSTRRKYLVNILTKENELAHEVPIVLTLSPSVSRSVSESLTKFYNNMDKCMSRAQDLGAAAKFSKEAHVIYAFCPRFKIIKDTNELTGKTYSYAGVESVLTPEYTDRKSAEQEVFKYTLHKKDWELAWQQQKDDFLSDYINKHSAQEAAKLAGAYGIADGVPALQPQGTVAILAPSIGERDETGALAGGLK